MRSKCEPTSTRPPANGTVTIAGAEIGINHRNAGCNLEAPRLRYAHRNSCTTLRRALLKQH